jgi:hypothetical protein
MQTSHLEEFVKRQQVGDFPGQSIEKLHLLPNPAKTASVSSFLHDGDVKHPGNCRYHLREKSPFIIPAGYGNPAANRILP